MPYSRFSNDQLILRDHLAIDRTVLANERTLLSYLRTSILLAASSITLIKLFPEIPDVRLIATALVPLALASAVIGTYRFEKMRRRIASALQPTDAPDENPRQQPR